MTQDEGTGSTRTVTKEDLEAILDSLLEGIVTLDAAGNIIGINRAACEILEVGRSEATGANCCRLLGSHLCQRAEAIRDSLQSGRPVSGAEVEVATSSGRRKVLQFQTTFLDGRGASRRGSVLLFRDVTELATLKETLARPYRLHNIVGKSKPMQEIFRLVEEVADSEATVLVEGESGTGKEMVARAIHHLSPRADGPFVPVNCSALAEGVLESELFGHVAGAFTGATRDKRGRFEVSVGGTIFLDEIGELAPNIQVKLLRVLQERVVEPVGSEESRSVDIRVIAATNRPLAQMVAGGSFRQDLYYRLRVVPITLPPLRERREDLPLLAQHFVQKFRESTGRAIDGLSAEALTPVLDYAWPGNVRELENAVEYAFVKAREGLIEPTHLPPEITGARPTPVLMIDGPHCCPPPPAGGTVPHAEQVHQALQATDWNVAKAARRLGVSRTTLYKRMAQQGIARPEE